MVNKHKEKNRQEYYSCLLKCRELTLEDINKLKDGAILSSTIEQLQDVVLPELEKLIDEYDGGIFPKKTFEDRWIHSYAMAFKVWCWDYNYELFKLLVRLNELYEKLM